MSAPVQQLIQQGIQAARDGNHAEARLILRQALSADSSNEQAWLWLSAVEATNSEKIAALQQVLAINPANAAAKRGLEMLKPTQIDFANLGQTSTAAPAKASFSPPPARAAGNSSLLQPRPSFDPSPAVPASNQSLNTVAPSLPTHAAQPQTVAPAVVEVKPTPEAENAVNYANDLVGSLRPAIAKGPKKRSVLPTRSELIISAILLVLLVGGFNLVRSALAGRLAGSRDSNAVTASERATSEALLGWNTGRPTPVVEVVIDPAQPSPVQPVQPVASGNLHQSRSYFLTIGETVVSNDGNQVLVNVTLQNPTNRPVSFRAADFTIQTNVGALPITAQSTILSTLTIPGNNTIAGILVAQANNGGIKSVQLVWRPTSGGISKTITLR
ncbi:tetratricopeptide repeat protein [Herpetosiphon sp. NSE202]|uniref:tetratricopeptide repeat protein n=1 Tax=Herpetosiphon sp. NSE202 TaxID=3351349 RepID=UPI00363CD0F0